MSVIIQFALWSFYVINILRTQLKQSNVKCGECEWIWSSTMMHSNTCGFCITLADVVHPCVSRYILAFLGMRSYVRNWTCVICVIHIKAYFLIPISRDWSLLMFRTHCVRLGIDLCMILEDIYKFPKGPMNLKFHSLFNCQIFRPSIKDSRI